MTDTRHDNGEQRFGELIKLVGRLRGPGGCPWDREQTHNSLKPMMLEEAYEVVEAIDEGDDEELIGELGDLLLQVIFHSRIAEEEGRFTIADVLARISDKMVRRHPHVFADDRADTSNEVLRNWEAIKAAELAEKGKSKEAEASMLDSVSPVLPAMMEAFQITTKVARVGFDWSGVDAVLEKLDEEIQELKGAAAPPNDVSSDSHLQANHKSINDEVGDMFFVMVNIARHLGVDPESALKASNRKFRRRFRHIEDRLREHGCKPADSTLEEMEKYWAEAKGKEKQLSAKDGG